ncbi:MAG: methyltransferase domain-containing protein [Chloroflexaceae bacterium]|nr:methyltransferase domain-containing protein [Chloroflexaceae bacterium]
MSSQLYHKIQQFYDASSLLWEQTWGEHMHHGYYGPSGTYRLNRRQAQIELVEALLSWAGVSRAACLVDVGCGIGGSTLYLAEKFTAKGIGITLSPVQSGRAEQRAVAAGLAGLVRFEVADALAMPFAPNSFDLVWSLESGEHMPDKARFLQECFRVLKPGGTLVMATWCHRGTDSWAGELTSSEKEHLAAIYQVYCLPYVISLGEYEQIARDCGFLALGTADWSAAVAPFWQAVMDSAWELPTFLGILQSGPETLRGALALDLMRRGYERGLIRFGLLRGTKA